LNFVQNQVSNGEAAAGKKEVAFLSLWGPAAVRGMNRENGAARVDLAYRFRPHLSCLMRDRIGAPGSCNIFPFKLFSSTPKLASIVCCPQFAPSEVLSPSCTLKSPLIESQPLNCSDFLLQFNLKAPYPKIMKISPKIPKFMIITSVFLYSHFTPNC
jgi:hypothetical protein